MSAKENKFVKTLTDAVTITGLAAGVGWLRKKVLKENFVSYPSSSLTNFVEFTVVVAGAIALKEYLVDEKILSDNV